MKKKLLIVTTVALMLLSLFLLTSCDEGLTKPQNLTLNVDTQTLHWKEVDGAQSYTVKISDGTEVTVYDPFYSLEYLPAGDYTIFVRSNGDGEVVKNSDFTRFSFHRDQETGLKYQLINNDTEYQLIGGGSASGDVVMEAVYRSKPVTAIAKKALFTHNYTHFLQILSLPAA